MKTQLKEKILTSDIEPEVGINLLKLGNHIETFLGIIDYFKNKRINKNILNENPSAMFYKFSILDDSVVQFFHGKTLKLYEIHLLSYNLRLFNKYAIGEKIDLDNIDSELYYDVDQEDVIYFNNVSGVGLLLEYDNNEKLSIGGFTIFNDKLTPKFPSMEIIK